MVEGSPSHRTPWGGPEQLLSVRHDGSEGSPSRAPATEAVRRSPTQVHTMAPPATFPSGRPDPPRPAPPAGPPPSHNPLRPGPRKMAVLGAPRGLAAAASRKRRLLLALALLRPPPAAALACFSVGTVGSGRQRVRAGPGGEQVSWGHRGGRLVRG